MNLQSDYSVTALSFGHLSCHEMVSLIQNSLPSTGIQIKSSMIFGLNSPQGKVSWWEIPVCEGEVLCLVLCCCVSVYPQCLPKGLAVVGLGALL